MIIVYKVSSITFLFAKLFVKIPYIGLANILAKEKIVPEIIQKKLLGEEIAKEIEKVIKNTEIMEKMRENLGRIKTMLGSSGASKRAAELALKLIN
jgi:lipid-A-disaccharide synthase